MPPKGDDAATTPHQKCELLSLCFFTTLCTRDLIGGIQSEHVSLVTEFLNSHGSVLRTEKVVSVSRTECVREHETLGR